MQNIPTYMNNLFSANITIARFVAVIQMPLAPCINRSTSKQSSGTSLASTSISITACTTPNRPLHKPFSLTLHHGCNAVVGGRVGCGKSTLLQIIAGECLIGASSSCSVAGRTLFVPQEPQLFKGSIRDNICLVHPCDEAKLQRALWAACLLEDIEALEHGLRTDVGSKGSNLSGGQRARVSIARILYHVSEYDILLLDDVFAALDEQTFSRLVNRMFVASSIPDSVTVILTCARGLTCPRPLHSILIRDGTILKQSVPQSTFEGLPSSPFPQSPRLGSLLYPSFSEEAGPNLKLLLELLGRESSRLPDHTLNCDQLDSCVSTDLSGGAVQDGGKLTQLVDWTNLAL